MPATAVHIDTQKLFIAIRDAFDESELRARCYELRIGYEDLPPGSKPDKALSLVQRCERERRLPELLEAVLRERPHIPRHSLIRDTRTDQSPFKGLLAFQEEDEAIFYGRDTLTTDLRHRLLSPVVRARQLDSSLSGKTNVLPTASPLPTTFLALVGASGSGKSSVVRAALIPALRRQTNWPIHLITSTTRPLETLAVTLTRESESVTAVTYERDQNPELAILLGIEAAWLNESNQAGASLLVDNSLRSILQEYGYNPETLTGHTSEVESVAFAPDGQTLASGSGDGTIWLWPTLKGLMEIGCQQVGRNLNWEEWQRYLPGQPYRQTCPTCPATPPSPRMGNR